MSIYDEMQLVASDLLDSDEFVQKGLHYIELTPGAGPRDNPGPPQEKSHTIRGGVAKGVEYKYVDGTQIVTSDGQITCPVPQAFQPKIRDFVIVNGKRYKIKMATGVPPTGTAVVYVIVYER